MPAPRVFVSSTCYDLATIRENLDRFINCLGYTPILSEKGNVFYDPETGVDDACIADVPMCNIFVLIIGGRFGSEYKDTGKSITNMEFEAALDSKVPIFTLIKEEVWTYYKFWKSNIDNRQEDTQKMEYPGVESTEIFEFIAEVENSPTNNAIFPFSNYENIETYLQQQWAGMMYQFLTYESQARQNEETLNAIAEMNKKIEFITRQIAESMETTKSSVANARIKIMDMIQNYILMNDMQFYTETGVKFTPEKVIEFDSLESLFEADEDVIIRQAEEGGIVTETPEGVSVFSSGAYREMNEKYEELRKKIYSFLEETDLSPSDLISN